MKKFSIYIVSSVLVILAVMFVLDVIYTKIYETSLPRTKFQYLRTLKDKKVDYIFIGSSRVLSGIVPSQIEKKTGKKVVNLGFQAAKLPDIYAVLQLVKEYNIRHEKILIQVDYIYNIVGAHSNMLEYEMMPFIRENEVTKRHSNQYFENSFANYYIPFYRYCNNDIKVGLREVFANLIRKKTNIINDKGYGANFGNTNQLSGTLPNVIIDKNAAFDSIQSFVKQNKMNVVFYCAPFCKYNEYKNYTSKLKAKIPGFVDLSQVLQDDKLFLDCNHLNDSGAKQLTEIITEQLLVREK